MLASIIAGKADQVELSKHVLRILGHHASKYSMYGYDIDVTRNVPRSKVVLDAVLYI